VAAGGSGRKLNLSLGDIKVGRKVFKMMVLNLSIINKARKMREQRDFLYKEIKLLHGSKADEVLGEYEAELLNISTEADAKVAGVYASIIKKYYGI
jgi:S-adenosylmethionine:diacylglycerol 3-amino-3-carboxypropyl transferase